MATPHEAKTKLRDFMKRHALPETRLTARTVSFSGFGYGERVFVKLHEAQLSRESWDLIENFAKVNGFSIDPN